MKRFPLAAKLLALAAVILMVMACLLRIEGLVAERHARSEEAARSVEQSHAAAQLLLGPVVQRTCLEEWDVTVDEKDKRTVHHEMQRISRVMSPASLAIDGRAVSEALHRGLYKINAYTAQFTVAAQFPNLAPLRVEGEHPGSKLTCQAPEVFVGMSDVRGIRSASMRVNGVALDVHPGSADAKYSNGFAATLPAAGRDIGEASDALAVQVSIGLVGTRELAWVPAARDVRWTLASDWPHPSFGGQFLPDSRVVRDDGFSATWHLSGLATTAEGDVAAGLSSCVPLVDTPDPGAAAETMPGTPPAAGRCLQAMGVAFIDPVNPYVMSDRAVKYASLFLLVTFAAVGLVELLSARRVHPMQYLLVGLALSVFFLLLLSLSEHVPFDAAYVIAAAACASLLGFYASAIFARWLAGLTFGVAIAALYGMLYALLQMEQNSLVIGAVALFAGLAGVMWLTRRVDWSAMFVRMGTGEGPAAS
jgi:inner membrane protein